AGSTVLYPPVYNLMSVRPGVPEQQLTFGDVSFVEPDIHPSGKLVASRIQANSDIWKIPVTGAPAENARRAVRITHQTGQTQTPSVSPDGKELVYLSDSGGHGNLWVVRADGSSSRQITFERDPAVSVGVPIWAPAGSQIVFIRADATRNGEWVVNSDGSGLRELLPQGASASWSPDGKWVYYGLTHEGESCVWKVPAEGGAPVRVRCDGAVAPLLAPSGTLYFARTVQSGSKWYDWEICKTRRENGPSEVLARILSSRVPLDPVLMQIFLSPDEKSL